ncbi:MAG: hypothetical protein OK449_08515 [Thaumarchaeota archaeon]|nr:hypothetical protein [Nitrososphaerota archaeon]
MPCIVAMSTDPEFRYVSEVAATVTVGISGVRVALSEVMVDVTVEVTVVATGVRVELAELTGELAELVVALARATVDVTVEVTFWGLTRRNPVVPTRMRMMMSAARKGNLKLMAVGESVPIFK